MVSLVSHPRELKFQGPVVANEWCDKCCKIEILYYQRIHVRLENRKPRSPGLWCGGEQVRV